MLDAAFFDAYCTSPRLTVAAIKHCWWSWAMHNLIVFAFLPLSILHQNLEKTLEKIWRPSYHPGPSGEICALRATTCWSTSQPEDQQQRLTRPQDQQSTWSNATLQRQAVGSKYQYFCLHCTLIICILDNNFTSYLLMKNTVTMMKMTLLLLASVLPTSSACNRAVTHNRRFYDGKSLLCACWSSMIT